MSVIFPAAYAKPPLTYAQQVARLQQCGMVIADPAEAELMLAGISYYRLSGYW